MAKHGFSASIDMTTGSHKELVLKLIRFALPIALVSFLEIFFQSFDLIAVQAKEGELAASAIGATGSLVTILTDLFLGLSMGVNVLIARYWGEKDPKRAAETAYSGIVLGTVFPLAVMLIGEGFLPTFLTWMAVGESFFGLATAYLRYYLMCLPFLSLYNFGSAIFRGMGDSNTPLLFLLGAGLLHVALDFAFVYGLGWSVRGVGMANAISYAAGTGLVFFFLRRRHSFFAFRFSRIRLYGKESLDILHLGVPNGIQNMVFSFTNLILAAIFNGFGPLVVTVMADSAVIESYLTTVLFAFSSASGAFVSANFGKGDIKNAGFIVRATVILEVILGLSLGGILLACHRPLLSLFNGGKGSEEYFSLGFNRLSILLMTLFLYGVMDTVTSALRGVNRPVIPMALTLIFVAGFRIFWDFAVYSPDPESVRHALWILYLCFPVSYAISASAQLIYAFLIRNRIRADFKTQSEWESQKAAISR